MLKFGSASPQTNRCFGQSLVSTRDSSSFFGETLKFRMIEVSHERYCSACTVLNLQGFLFVLLSKNGLQSLLCILQTANSFPRTNNCHWRTGYRTGISEIQEAKTNKKINITNADYLKQDRYSEFSKSFMPSRMSLATVSSDDNFKL